MQISKRNASMIVKEISSIIGERVNMMNQEGIIIASTDPTRIGTFHAASKKIINEKLDEIVIHEENEYEGSRPGINLPIVFNGEIMGTIGVTGSSKEVVKYGQIIKKMTEILIRDHYYHEQKEIDKNIHNRFIEEWICGDIKNVNPAMVDRGNSLGIDITLLRRIMIFSPIIHKDMENKQDQEYEQRLINGTEAIISQILAEDKNNILLKTTKNVICAVTGMKDKDVMYMANRIKTVVESQYEATLAIGIDSPIDNYMLIHNAYGKAQKALQACIRSQSKDIRFYNTINMEIFSGEIPDLIKLEYIRRIFRGYSAEEISQWIRILEVFFEEDGSITKTAERLFIHKNTLQYKLNKLKERTGYDTRSIRYSSLFYIAVHFYRDICQNIPDFVD